MNHEIVGPEVAQVTGQLRLPKDIAISKHIAQFDTRDHYPDGSSSKQSAIEKQKAELEEKVTIGEVVVPLIAKVLSKHESEELVNYSTGGPTPEGQIKTIGYVISYDNSPVNVVDDKIIYLERDERPDIEQQGRLLKEKLKGSAIVSPIDGARMISMSAGARRSMGEPWGYEPIRMIVQIGWKVTHQPKP